MQGQNNAIAAGGPNNGEKQMSQTNSYANFQSQTFDDSLLPKQQISRDMPSFSTDSHNSPMPNQFKNAVTFSPIKSQMPN